VSELYYPFGNGHLQDVIVKVNKETTGIRSFVGHGEIERILLTALIF
jgi:hypothetical protein